MATKPTRWESYEKVATYLLDQFASEFGLEKFEGKQIIRGRRSSTEYEIDAKGVGGNNEVFVIVECRRYTRSRQNQERIGGLAYRIIDTGAKGGILVSPLGMQEGAAKIAHAENIHNVILDKNSTTTQYLMHFLNKVRYGIEVSLDTDVTVSWSPQITQDDKTVEDSGEA